MLYLDHNATTPIVSKKVKHAIKTAPWNNPNSFSTQSLDALSIIKTAEDRVRQTIGAVGGTVYWVQSGSMANYLAINAPIWTKSDLFFSSPTDHKSIVKHPKKQLMFAVDTVGKIRAEHFNVIMPDEVNLATCTYVNNETGVIQPIEYVRDIYHNAHLHVDCVQALGKIDINVKKMGADSITLSSHKIYGPKGIACLWVKEGIDLQIPYLGTPPTELIAGFSAALLELHPAHYCAELEIKETHFLNILHKELIHGLDFIHNIPAKTRVPGTLSIQFSNIDADLLVIALDSIGLHASTGSACNAKDSIPSHVLTSIGLTEQQAASTVRFSFGKLINPDESITAAKLVAKTYKELYR